MSTSTAPAMFDVVELLHPMGGWEAGARGTVVDFYGDALGIDMTGAYFDDDDPREPVVYTLPDAVRVTWRAPIRDA